MLLFIYLFINRWWIPIISIKIIASWFRNNALYAIVLLLRRLVSCHKAHARSLWLIFFNLEYLTHRSVPSKGRIPRSFWRAVRFLRWDMVLWKNAMFLAQHAGLARKLPNVMTAVAFCNSQPHKAPLAKITTNSSNDAVWIISLAWFACVWF